MKNEVKLFERQKVRTHWDESEEKWYFSIIDVIAILTGSVNPRDYWFKMKTRVKTEEGLELSTVCRQLKMKASDGKMRETDVTESQVLLRIIQSLTNIIHTEWASISVKQHKNLKGLKTQNLRDHMSEAELIFTALAELSTRQIAETEKADGLRQNAVAGKKGGKIAKDARLALERKTGKKVITGENFLPPSNKQKKIGKN